MTAEKKHDLSITMIPDEAQLNEPTSSPETNRVLGKMFDYISKKRTKQEH